MVEISTKPVFRVTTKSEAHFCQRGEVALAQRSLFTTPETQTNHSIQTDLRIEELTMLGATFVCFAIASITGILGFSNLSMFATVISNVLLAVFLMQFATERMVGKIKPQTKHTDR